MASAALAGQVVVVTGASRGIGRAIALHCAGHGASVAGLARPSANLESLPDGAGAGSDRILAIPCDVSSPAQVEAAFDQLETRLGCPTLLVTCAGTAEVLGPAWSADPEEWWQAVAIDLRGTMLAARAAVRRMLAVGTGRLVTIYGNLGDRQLGNVSAFGVAKAGIARFTESLACELVNTEIRVVCVHPGFVRTPMTERLAMRTSGRAWLPEFGARAEGRWGDASQAADLVVSIAMGEADELAGRVIYPDDDLVALTEACKAAPDLRRLRLILG